MSLVGCPLNHREQENYMKKLTWILGIALGVSMAFNVYAQFRTTQMVTMIELIGQKEGLHSQSVNEMMWAKMTEVREGQIETARGQGKIEGIIAVIANQKPNEQESNQIWHAGYYRGLDQGKDMKVLQSSFDTLPVTDKADAKK